MAWKRAWPSQRGSAAGWRLTENLAFRLVVTDMGQDGVLAELLPLAYVGSQLPPAAKLLSPAATQKVFQCRVKEAKRWAEALILDPLVVLARATPSE